ncbi:MAG: hypothetical protein C4532_08780 [Candidatus Abyssobacteria bacterium SURF_17]|uniref:Uncharacterized protein n=1 Tax=Candidatus Abyssobacteria bacterium SURF_17 TaxID=2093361 RepID=A0A419EZD8_9BACT|nr:MAG: hypothetical protein C4532_08780 [Candidatus Abyssubacteria bacterium SURF_17]
MLALLRRIHYRTKKCPTIVWVPIYSNMRRENKEKLPVSKLTPAGISGWSYHSIVGYLHEP